MPTARPTFGMGVLERVRDLGERNGMTRWARAAAAVPVAVVHVALVIARVEVGSVPTRWELNGEQQRLARRAVWDRRRLRECAVVHATPIRDRVGVTAAGVASDHPQILWHRLHRLWGEPSGLVVHERIIGDTNPALGVLDGRDPVGRTVCRRAALAGAAAARSNRVRS